MTTRFNINLLRTGGDVGGERWTDWFVGDRGPRRLAYAALAGGFVLAMLALVLILPTYWRLASDLETIPNLQKELASTDADLAVLRSSLQALTAEAKRQVRWSELLTAFSQQVPPTLRLTRLEATTTAPSAPAPGAPPPPPGTPAPQTETSLKVDSLTPVRPGSAALLEIAQFMAGLMRDPAVNRRFQLRGWEIKPLPGEPTPMLGVGITMSERPQP
jgi:hypothetical protein